jgi:hypothetical protein
VSQRSLGLTEPEVERAVADGEILRTHVLRPTWHFVAPRDIRWMLELTRARVRALSAFGVRREKLDAQTFKRAHSVLAQALEGGGQLTRNELGASLGAAGIAAQGTRLAYILMHAELEGLICSGTPRGKQHTYALLEERVPPVPRLSRDEALVELTCRYFTSHGPASTRDFQWWSSLSMAEVRRGLELAASLLRQESIGGVTYWCGRSTRPAKAARRAHLLQMFDEYLVGYSQTRGALDAAGIMGSLFSTINVRSGAIILDTQLAGTWKRSVTRDGLVLDVRLPGPLDAEQTAALQAEADRYAAFLGRQAIVRTLD